MAKAVNTAANRVGFALVVTLNEKQISGCITSLEKEYTVAVGYAKDDSATCTSKLAKPSSILLVMKIRL